MNIVLLYPSNKRLIVIYQIENLTLSKEFGLLILEELLFFIKVVQIIIITIFLEHAYGKNRMILKYRLEVANQLQRLNYGQQEECKRYLEDVKVE